MRSAKVGLVLIVPPMLSMRKSVRFSRALPISVADSSTGAESASVARRARGTERLRKRMTRRYVVLACLVLA